MLEFKSKAKYAARPQFPITEEHFGNPEYGWVIAESLLHLETGEAFIDYLNFQINGHTKVVDLFDKEQLYHFYRLASSLGHESVLTYLETRVDALEAAKSNDYGGFKAATIFGHLGVMKHYRAIPNFDEPPLGSNYILRKTFWGTPKGINSSLDVATFTSVCLHCENMITLLDPSRSNPLLNYLSRGTSK